MANTTAIYAPIDTGVNYSVIEWPRIPAFVPKRKC